MNLYLSQIAERLRAREPKPVRAGLCRACRRAPHLPKYTVCRECYELRRRRKSRP